MRGSIYLAIVTLLISLSVMAENEKMLEIKKNRVGELFTLRHYQVMHQRPSIYSTVVSTIACGESVTVYDYFEGPKLVYSLKSDWVFISVLGKEGFIRRSHLGEAKRSCHKDRYPKFIDLLDFTPLDAMYWGRLEDEI